MRYYLQVEGEESEGQNKIKMNSSVYEIRGCYGSQKMVEVESMLDAKTAKQNARARNQRSADGSGMSLRAWMKEKSNNAEGVCFSARSGKDGYRYGV